MTVAAPPIPARPTDRVAAILHNEGPMTLDQLMDAGYRDLGNEIAANRVVDALLERPHLWSLVLPD